jgi:hypothetical protein
LILKFCSLEPSTTPFHLFDVSDLMLGWIKYLNLSLALAAVAKQTVCARAVWRKLRLSSNKLCEYNKTHERNTFLISPCLWQKSLANRINANSRRYVIKINFNSGAKEATREREERIRVCACASVSQAATSTSFLNSLNPLLTTFIRRRGTRPQYEPEY